MWAKLLELNFFVRKTFRGHPKTQTMQTVQTEYLKRDSLFLVPQLQNRVQYFLMFVMYPQPEQTRHLTVDSVGRSEIQQGTGASFKFKSIN